MRGCWVCAVASVMEGCYNVHDKSRDINPPTISSRFRTSQELIWHWGTNSESLSMCWNLTCVQGLQWWTGGGFQPKPHRTVKNCNKTMKFLQKPHRTSGESYHDFWKPDLFKIQRHWLFSILGTRFIIYLVIDVLINGPLFSQGPK